MNVPTLSIDRLSTERLLLIPFTTLMCQHFLDNDFSDLVNLGLKLGRSWPDQDVMETLPRIIHNLARVEAPTGFESWMIIKKNTLEVIGDAGFKGYNHKEENADLGYGIIKEERRMGYAQEAATALIQWAFTNKTVTEITARCAEDNVGSIRLLQKMDFRTTGKEEDMICWSLRKHMHSEQD